MKVIIGTSGWVYHHWQEIFYPQNLSQKDWLSYFSSHFKSAEINSSFYHLPKSSTFSKWYLQTPSGFIFSVKVSRFITHIKRLKGVELAWKNFLKRALNLKEKLGPFLFQFPPSFKKDERNFKRFKNFLNYLDSSFKYGFEFRHRSFHHQEIYKILKKHNCAWVISDSSIFPKAEVITADFIYLRMHGPKNLFSSCYSQKELKKLAEKIKRWKKEREVYIYFNNDAFGYAIKNAKMLINLTENE